ncbi:right-handed parallel beta-helix repeat-containing protein, partial [Micromonospora andamanensis]
AAIKVANAEHGATLKLARECTYSLTNSTPSDGLPPITQPITIKGDKSKIARAAGTTAQFRIFTVANGGDLRLEGVTLTGGQAPAPGGGAINVAAGGTVRLKESHLVNNSTTGLAAGGAINNLGTVEMEKTTLERNISAVAGGAINNFGLLKIKESRFLNNSAGLGGGAINNGPIGTTQAYKVELRGNRAVGGGGAIANTATGIVGGIVDIHYAEITNNNAALAGGGILTTLGARTTLRHINLANNGATLGGGGLATTVGSTTTIEDSKITGNVTNGVNVPGLGGGGGILNGPASTVVLRNTEVSGNQATNGGGISNAATGIINLTTTKIVNNTALVAAPGGAGGILNGNPTGITADPHTVIT